MKETKIEKLILDLSTRWEVSPEEAVDRLNSMNESEINKLINSMTKKFKNGGMIDCLRKGGSIKDCGCGSKIEKAQGGNPDLGKYHLQLSNGNNYSLSGYGLNPQRTVETLTTPKDVITRTIDRDTVVTRNGQIIAPTVHFHQNFDEMKEKAILANKGEDYLDYRKKTGTFDEGGKVRGGNWRDYHTIINAPGDTLRFKQYYSGPTTMQTHPEGGITYTKSSTDGISHMYGSGYKPNMWERFVLRMSPVDAETEQNWQQLIKNHANDPAVKDKTQKKACGGSIEKVGSGTKIGSATYQIKKGDNLIKIARQFGLNSLDELLSLNPQIKNPNMIYEGQVLNLPKDKMKQNGKVEAASVSDKMPNYDQVDYAKLPASVKTKVDAYAQAIRDHKMKVSNVPALYRQQAYNQSIRSATNEAAPMVATKVMMAPWTIPDTVIRGGLNETRKLINGKDDSGDYGVGDYFDGNFSWLGKEYQKEHPVADAVINAVTTPVVMIGAENVAARAMDGTLTGTMARASANAKATARTMGVQPEPVTVEYTMGKTGGHSYKGPGAGKAHTRGSVNNASYRQVPVSSKVVDPMNFVENPAASGFTGTGYWHGFPAVLPEQEKPNYVIVEPEKEYMEETIVSPNKWIYDTRTPDVVVPYAIGNETITYTKGNANKGRSPEEQAIMKESIETGQGNPKPGVKVKKGEVTGSPSGYYSGFGYTYGTEGGPWLTYQQKGGILNKYKKK